MSLTENVEQFDFLADIVKNAPRQESPEKKVKVKK